MKEPATDRKQAQAARGATERVLALLQAVADQPDATLAQLARAVELPASTALRLLRTLEAAGFAVRVGDGYRPGPALVRIGLALAAARPLPLLAQPVLDQLAATTGESSYLAVPAGGQRAAYAAAAPGRHAVRHTSWLGQQVSRRATAAGAALVGRVDADGVVVRSDAVEAGVTAVAAPVRGADGRAVAAVSVVGPSFRLQGPALAAARRAVAAGALRMSRSLGGAADTD